MKKIVPVLALVVLIGAIWFVSRSRQEAGEPTQSAKSDTVNKSAETQSNPSSGTTDGGAPNGVRDDMIRNVPVNGNSAPAREEAEEFDEPKPAVEVYKTAEEAFDAIKKGAKDYDDVILEQFTQPGEACSWCDKFYETVKGTLQATDTPADEKSYLAEILAISGRADNVQTLIDSVKSAKSSEEADTYAEALELTVGGDDVTQLLGENMTSTNEALREASVAAVTNQGSRMAAELLLKNTVERGDPDGYYSLGIGLGEFIPDDEALPVLQGVVSKRDQFSHLGVKALINGGLNGLRLVFDELEASKDPEFDRKMLKDALDHVNYEEGLQEFNNEKISTTKQPVAKEFAQQINDEFSEQGEETP